MGNDGARSVGMEKAVNTLEESIAGVTKAVGFVQGSKCSFWLADSGLATTDR